MDKRVSGSWAWLERDEAMTVMQISASTPRSLIETLICAWLVGDFPIVRFACVSLTSDFPTCCQRLAGHGASTVVARASRPCESCNRHTGETPVPLPSQNQTPAI